MNCKKLNKLNKLNQKDNYNLKKKAIILQRFHLFFHIQT